MAVQVFQSKSSPASASTISVDTVIAVGASRGANPVNSTQVYNKRMVVEAAGGIPSRPSVQMSRNLNPRLNTQPWSISMAQQRQESRKTRRQRKRKGY